MKEIRTEDAVGHILCHDITQIIKDKKKGVLFSSPSAKSTSLSGKRKKAFFMKTKALTSSTKSVPAPPCTEPM